MKNKSKTYAIILILILIILAICSIKYIIAKYNNVATAEDKIDIAFYALTVGNQTESIKINGLSPLGEKYEYNILVSNSKAGKTSETAIEYTISITATTNLPLKYELYKYDDVNKENELKESEVIQDEDGTYYIHLITEKKEFTLEECEDRYVLTIDFPEEHKNLIEYQDILEFIEISIDSKQKN